MTDKEKLRVEIERRYKTNLIGMHTPFRNGKCEAFREVLETIDSIPEEPKFCVGDIVASTKNPSLTYKVLQVGLPNELGKLDYEVEIFTDGKEGIKVGNAFKEHNIHLISCEKMDEWGKLILEESISEDLKEAAENALNFEEQTFMYDDPETKEGMTEVYTREQAIAMFKAGAKWQKEQTIDKAVEWIYNKFIDYYKYEETKEFIEDFRKALEEE